MPFDETAVGDTETEGGSDLEQVASSDEGRFDAHDGGQSADGGGGAEAGDSDAAAEPVGERVDEVELEIDYAIVRHFSEHLYGSPNKAVEELVANSFDAMARETYVYVPGRFTQQVIVWDDGESMDVAGLKAMWKIARSPKQGAARVRGEGARERRLIGKFGIGKLASYAVGDRISHLCKRDGDYLLVGVDYRDVQRDLGADDDEDAAGGGGTVVGEEPTGGSDDQDAVGDDEVGVAPAPTSVGEADLASSSEAHDEAGPAEQDDGVFRTDIRRLTEDEAREWVAEILDTEAKAMSLFDKPSFTLAVVDRVHEDLTLYPGRLGWVLGNSMPLRPDFVVSVDDGQVSPRLGRDAKVTWDARNDKIKESIKNTWAAAVEDGTVEGEIVYDNITCKVPPAGDQPAIRFPDLGDVAFTVSLHGASLHRDGETNDERSYGYFVMVRGRLINTDDAALYLAPPSYGTFYRMQVVIHADGLDPDLLADRGRMRDSRRTTQLAILQRAIYRAARAEIERQDEDTESDNALYHLLPTRSQRFFRDPLNALLMSTEGGAEIETFHFDQPDVVRDDLPEDQPLAVIAEDGSGFTINVAHPFFQALREAVGQSARGERAMRAFELVAVGERLLEGYLLDQGVEPAKVKEIVSWRDELMRQLASRYRDQPEAVVSEVWTTSYKPGKKFEKALAKMFNLMGFVATRRGAPGEEDVLVVAPTGLSEAKFIVDAKGSKNPVANDTSELAQAAGHVHDVDGATVAIVVAREFVGFKRGGDAAAVLRDCRGVSKGEDGNKVSVVDVPTLIELFWAVERWSYPLEVILPVLEEIETPEDKRKRIAALDNPMDTFDYLALLDHLWTRQQEEAAGDVVPYRTLWQQEYRDGGLTIDEMEKKLGALEVLADPLLVLDRARQTVQLRQSPDKVAAQIQRGLERVAAVRAEQKAAAPEQAQGAPAPAASGAPASSEDGDEATAEG